MRAQKSLCLAFILLITPSNISCQQVEVKELGQNTKIFDDGNSVSWREDDKPGRTQFNCEPEDGYYLAMSADNKYAACCSQAQSLKGPKDTGFACCGGGHDIAGNTKVGFLCCPEGQDFDGRLCQ
ncbi:uncharacterized protein PpBr36_10245 [Pyricularia pennisetigena]|uniref:uncharacterized protein n=1 Tax=Pyricularia pennisetigena TaxID=1578925 RepID=UPI0011539B71|nr:uncharacterized protein PpBr36_10245 [Pyricularia pennisetigena]TLS21395.1 hypothetical protein PpBr36_10245 [Pyricularia pennisetigena]